jgi:hypothetical protein
MGMLTFNLKNQVRDTQASAVGVEQYNGGEVLETQGNKLVAVFMAISQTVSRPPASTDVTNAHNLNTAMFDMSLFFISAQGQHGHGGGGGGGGKANAPEVIRLQGSVDFEGKQPPTLKNEKDIQEAIGSVSAASPAWQHLIGHKFTLKNLTDKTGQLEIEL